MEKPVAEAGKRNNKTDMASIQAIHDGAAELGATCVSDERESVAPSPWICASLREALREKDSLSNKVSKIHNAVRKHYENSRHYAYPQAIFDKHVIVNSGDKLYQHSYSTGSNGDVSLGDPSEVEATYSPIRVAATESAEQSLEGDIIPLVEAAVSAEGKTKIKVIAPGWGSSGYYGADMLERDGSVAFPVGTKMYLDHPTAVEEKARPERSVKDLAAVLKTPAKWDAQGAAGPGLYAEAEVMPSHRQFVNDFGKHIGVSIRAAGTSKLGEAEGRKGPIIERIAVGKSIDFVTQAGAGGKILTESGREASSLRDLFEAADSRTGEDVDNKELQEAQAQNAKLQEQLARANEVLLLNEAGVFVAEQLAGQKTLPDLTRKRLQESLAKRPVVKDGKLDKPAFKELIAEAVKEEVEYIAQLTGSGKVRGMGEGSEVKEAKQDASEKLELDALTESFVGFGMSKEAAAIAAKGRR